MTASNEQDLAKLKERAEAAGLSCLTDAHLAQLKRATESMRKRKEQLTIELAIADEPAHVFSLKAEG